MNQRTSKLIFVVGVWRSGTSLLYTLLQNHPQIALTYEAEPLALFPRKAKAICQDDWATRLEFFNQAISRHHLETAALPTQATVREAILALSQAWAARKDASVMGGKSPSYHRYLPDVAKIFPEAEFIIIWRNPLDICRSVLTAGRKDRFFGGKGILTRAFFGSEQLAQGVLKLRADGRRVHEIVYQELTANPEKELQKICGFLGLEYDARMLDLKTADYSMLPAGDHHALARSGVVQQTAARAEILHAKFIAKGNRYLALWRRRYAGLAFIRALPDMLKTEEPGWLEKLADHGIYWVWVTHLGLKHLFCRSIPLSLWRRLRGEGRLASLKNSTPSFP